MDPHVVKRLMKTYRVLQTENGKLAFVYEASSTLNLDGTILKYVLDKLVKKETRYLLPCFVYDDDDYDQQASDLGNQNVQTDENETRDILEILSSTLSDNMTILNSPEKSRNFNSTNIQADPLRSCEANLSPDVKHISGRTITRRSDPCIEEDSSTEFLWKILENSFIKLLQMDTRGTDERNPPVTASEPGESSVERRTPLYTRRCYNTDRAAPKAITAVATKTQKKDLAPGSINILKRSSNADKSDDLKGKSEQHVQIMAGSQALQSSQILTKKEKPNMKQLNTNSGRTSGFADDIKQAKPPNKCGKGAIKKSNFWHHNSSSAHSIETITSNGQNYRRKKNGRNVGDNNVVMNSFTNKNPTRNSAAPVSGYRLASNGQNVERNDKDNNYTSYYGYSNPNTNLSAPALGYPLASEGLNVGRNQNERNYEGNTLMNSFRYDNPNTYPAVSSALGGEQFHPMSTMANNLTCAINGIGSSDMNTYEYGSGRAMANNPGMNAYAESNMNTNGSVSTMNMSNIPMCGVHAYGSNNIVTNTANGYNYYNIRNNSVNSAKIPLYGVNAYGVNLDTYGQVDAMNISNNPICGPNTYTVPQEALLLPADVLAFLPLDGYGQWL